MNRITQLQAERTELMSGLRTHSEWVKVMERLAEISAELLTLKNEGEIVIGQPPVSTHEQREAARRKLMELNQFRKNIAHAAI